MRFHMDFREQVPGLLQMWLVLYLHILQLSCLKTFHRRFLIKMILINNFLKTSADKIFKNLCSLQSINLGQPNMKNDIKQNSLIREIYGYI